MWIDSQICGCLNDSFLISLRSMLEKIKVDLPHYPDQVIQDWLVPFAKSAQWPPQKGTRWVNIFPNKNISLDFWREVGWKKKRVLIDDMRLTDQSKSFIHHMYVYMTLQCHALPIFAVHTIALHSIAFHLFNIYFYVLQCSAFWGCVSHDCIASRSAALHHI